MLDILIRGAEVVDGTGAPGRHVDVGVAGGRIVVLGPTDESAREVIDADGLVVAPGFIDIHTHYDAQLLWDPYASPSSLCGITTVIAGNCGFTLAPAGPDDRDYLARMLSRVEGMSLESLRQGVDWTWTSFGEYLDRLEGRTAVNAGFLVGHSTLRRFVMGEQAHARADAEALDRMAQVLAESLRAGGLGFSSSHGTAHLDLEGNPVPSRASDRDEVLALASVTSAHPGTTLEYITGLPTAPFTDEELDLLIEMSRVGRRPVNWNLLAIEAGQEAVWQSRLAASDVARERGAYVTALVLPIPPRTRLTFATGFLLELIPGWEELFRLPVPERAVRLGDATVRDRMRADAARAESRHRERVRFDGYTIAETFTPGTAGFAGRKVGDLARELGRDPLDVILDISIADDLRTVLLPEPRGSDDRSWEYRSGLCRDGRVIVGGSDAGAHLDMLDAFAYPVEFIGEAVRRRELVTMEEAIHALTDVPAREYGIRERGRVGIGWKADLVVFDPATVGVGPVVTRKDLPGGGERLYGEAVGMSHVIVNGVEIARDGEFRGATPGTVLRSGRDTDTVWNSTPLR